MAARCRCPPDNVAGLRCSSSEICSNSAVSCTFLSIKLLGFFFMRRQKAMFPYTVFVGYRA